MEPRRPTRPAAESDFASSPPPRADGWLGRTISARYRLERIIGRGGSGALFAAHDLALARDVALKLLLPRDAESSPSAGRFVQEARIAGSLRHPHIVEIFDAGVEEHGVSYLVMELLEGRSLAEELVQVGTIDAAMTLGYLAPIMGALAFAHVRGVLHRDIKPENVFLARNTAGRIVPKLLDFGIAKQVDAETITSSGTIVGTPAFMSPEQALAEPLTQASDIWSMGVLWFRCLSGRVPFEADALTGLLLKIVNTAPPKLEHVRADLPRGLSVAIDRALRREAHQRYGSMPEFCQALLESVAATGAVVPDDPDPIGLPDWRAWRVGVSTTTRQLAAPILQQAPAMSQLAAPREASAPSSRRIRAALLGFFVAVALLAAASWWARRDAVSEQVPQAQPELAREPVGGASPAVQLAAPSAASATEKNDPAIAPAPSSPSAAPVAPSPEPTRAEPTSDREARPQRASRRPPAKGGAFELETDWR